MKGGLGIGLVVIGLVLLWVVVTGRTANFAAAWATLRGTPTAGGDGTGAPTAGPAGVTWGSVTRKALEQIWHPPALP